MSLFKPSNLTPNFESVVYNRPLFLTFQVNSNDSKVTAYRVQILTDFNDKDNLDENIIGTIYGKFEKPLYNKDTGEILLSQETLKYNGIFLEPNKDYRWRLRLYGEVKNQNNTTTECDAPVTISSGNTSSNAIRSIDVCKDFDIQKNNNYETAENKNFLIIAQEDISIYLSDMIDKTYPSIQTFCQMLYTKTNKFYMYTSDIADKTEKERIDFFKNKIHPVMYIYQFMFDKDSINKYIRLPSKNQYTICYSFIDYYTSSEDIDLSYVGNGNLVGSTKQIMWTRQYNPYMKIDSYAQLLISANRMDFQPFLPENNITIERLTEEGMSASNYVTVSKSFIKKEYLKEMANGNFYLLLFNEKSPTITEEYLDIFLITGFAKKIISVENYDEGTHLRIYTSDYEEIQNYSDTNYKYLSLFYIQRQKIIQIDKNVGENNLVKITFKEPFDYNPENDQNIYFGCVSDDFDYDRVYIDPVEEFDNSDGFSYIYIFPIGGEIKGANLSQSDIDKMIEDGKCFKIINYVSSTGEVTLYGKTSFIPTIQLQYQVFKRNTEKSYDLITGTGKNNHGNGTAFLGGYISSSLPLISNHSVTGTGLNANASNLCEFDKLFVQPNILIKDDNYHPNVLEVYNQKYKNRLCITNLYNEYYEEKYTQYGIKSENIDTLDDTMYYISAKNVDNCAYNLGSHGESGNAYTLYNPQTQYKIYSNFVDCAPEGFFYSRYDKNIKFEIYDLNRIDEENNQDIYVIKNNKIYLNDEEKDSIPFRDLYIKAICQDYKIIDRTETTDTTLDNTKSRFLNGKQYFIGISKKNYLYKNALENVNLTNEGGSFKTVTDSTGIGPVAYDNYGIGYDIKVIPGKEYTISVNGENYFITIGLYNSKGELSSYLSNKTTFTPGSEEYYAMIIICSLDTDLLTTYSQLKINNEPIISFEEELGTNNVSLKEYHYEIMSEDKTIIYSTEETYDGKFSCKFRGCNNNKDYYIKVYIEDDFGKMYTSLTKVPIRYENLIDNTNIAVTPLCEKQAIKINFAAIKEIDGSGEVYLNKDGINISNDIGLTYEKVDDNENILQIPQNFSYLTQFTLKSNILDTKKRRLINKIISDNSDVYYLYFDAKPYFYNEQKYDLNPTYMKFIITVNKELSEEEKIISDNETIFIKDVSLEESEFITPTQFAFIATTETTVNDKNETIAVYHDDYIYIIPDQLSDVAEGTQRDNFSNTVPANCIDENGNLNLYYENKSDPNDNIYLINDTSKYITYNKIVLENMKVQTFKIIKTKEELTITIE